MDTDKLHSAYDVIVVGSGASGMTAALTAAVAGLSVLVVEKSAHIGGTSAMSGGGTWVPANHHAAQAGIADSADESFAYMVAALGAKGDEAHVSQLRALAENAGPMLRLVEENSPLRFALTPEPDPMSAVPGAKAKGRMVSPLALRRKHAGPFEKKLRPSTLPQMMTYHEMISPSPWTHPFKTVFTLGPTILKRLATNAGGQGSALMAGLIGGCLDHGVTIVLSAPARNLERDETGAVTGLTFDDGGKAVTIAARRGVVLATGGFEWNKDRFARHFPGPTDWLTSPSTNTGDGHALAEEAGALLDRMEEANVHPAMPTRYEGRMHGMPVAWHSGAHGIVVNRHGERFISEYDYNLGEALERRDPETGEPIHTPAWLIGDWRFLLNALPFLYYVARGKGWLRMAGSLDGLARKTGLPADRLRASVERFNGFCRDNRDADFARGESTWERFRSGWSSGDENPSLKPIGRAPFIAIPVNRSILGTKGGPRTNARGEVLRPDGSTIPGLFAAGGSMANPIGTRVVGAGTTIGPYMTWGYICGRTLAGD